MSSLESAITCAVEFLAPKGSCSYDRWLTFDLKAEGNDREGNPQRPFEWLAQYCSPSGYINYRIMLKDGVPHTELTHRSSWITPRAPWVPTASLTETDVPETIRGKRNEAPGFVISSGAHDSCWRDHGTQTRGWPNIPTNMYTDQQGVERQNFTDTRYFDIYNDSILSVNGISIKGPTGEAGWQSEESAAQWKTFTDGTWVNDTGLTGAWAVFYGMSKLSPTVDRDFLEIRIDGHWDKGEYGKKGFKEARILRHYRITDGKVTHVGIPQEENDYFLKGWAEVAEPYVLDQHRFMLDCGFTEKTIPQWKLSFLHPEVQNSHD